MTTYKAKDLDLQKLGINNDLVISRNLSYQDLVSDIVKNSEGHIASNGAAMIDSGKYTSILSTINHCSTIRGNMTLAVFNNV